MVFRSISATHPNTTNIVMASSTTVKPHQPLHNFPLQDLKWSMNPSNNATNHHRFRSNKSPHRDAAAADSDGDGGVKVEKLSKQKSDDAETLEKKSKIFIRLRTNKNSSGSSSSKCMVDDVAADAGDLDSAAVVEDVEESIPKTWNLRPRRAVNKGLNGSGGAVKIGGGAVQEIKSQVTSSNRSEWTRSNRNGNDATNYDNNNNNNNNKEKEKEKEKEKKLRFSIPLTREEIEEDIYSLTGSKPARRSKKRAKHVQKQLDCLFPGMWLASITPECYKVHEAPSKG
ncbi:uncharacterized protein LOC133692435 isoform X2 [Populus nigra]|uniref:uncharacterized protein LOC133692435 isoform X2 n=1 Tax=Populus nigra TaxID=3691 RepID=UPI002B26DFDB|nr:uncharacterized protein LOC133692435 isoform X2 [Populus nigra]